MLPSKDNVTRSVMVKVLSNDKKKTHTTTGPIGDLQQDLKETIIDKFKHLLFVVLFTVGDQPWDCYED